MDEFSGEHPDSSVLEKFMRNELDADERRRVVRHLISGCSRCVAITAQLWALGDVPEPAPAETLEGPAAGLEDSARAHRASAGAGYRSVFGRLTRAARARESRIAAERQRAPRLVAELLRHPPAGRLGLVWSEKRFQTPSVCELLVETGKREALQGQVPASLDLAELAVAACERLDSRLCGRAFACGLHAWAWSQFANARRLAGDAPGAELGLARAELLFREAVSDTVRRGSGLDRQEAEMLALKAELRAGQGKLAEAGRLLDRALALFRVRLDPLLASGWQPDRLPPAEAREVSRILIKKGLLHCQAGNAPAALDLLRAAARRLEALPDPAAADQAGQGPGASDQTGQGPGAPDQPGKGPAVGNNPDVALLACALHHLAALLARAAAGPQTAAPGRQTGSLLARAGETQAPRDAAPDPATLQEEALAALRRAIPLYEALGDRANQARLLRLQGAIDAALGRTQAAEASLLAARPALLREGLGREAAASLLDLATLYARHGRLGELRGLAQRVPALLACIPDRAAHAATPLGTVVALLVFDRLAETLPPAAAPATPATPDPAHADFLGEMARYLAPTTTASHPPCPPC